MTAYYNENDPKAAAWLRELVKEGAIAPGEVDDRSILDVAPAELAGFTQCHFFAGIGVWSYALRLAGWDDSRPVWTGSCPCQPFSSAGKGAGFADERHLWPVWHYLIRECRPAILFGEQVASKNADPWIDLVCADLEAMGYAFGAVPFPAAGIGAPHIRDRTYWVADSERRRLDQRQRDQGGSIEHRHDTVGFGGDGRMADSSSERRAGLGLRLQPGAPRLGDAGDGRRGEAGGMAHTNGRDASAEREQRSGQQRQQPQDGGVGGVADAGCEQRERGPDAERPAGQNEAERGESVDHYQRCGINGAPGPVNGLWRGADWLFCRDGKWRPVEPGSFPLAHGAPARVGRLRGYGNAIVAEAAAEFIRAAV